MKLDLPSFLLGCGAGASTLLFGRRLRPMVLETATFLYRCMDSALARASVNQAHLAHLISEARARAARGAEPAPVPKEVRAWTPSTSEP